MEEQTKAFALRVVRFVSGLPKSRVTDVLGYQLLKAGTSIGANYREANLAEVPYLVEFGRHRWCQVTSRPSSLARRGNGLLRVPFVEAEGERKILTVYWTSKVEKYWREEQDANPV